LGSKVGLGAGITGFGLGGYFGNKIVTSKEKKKKD
jgi:hypothetical protein